MDVPLLINFCLSNVGAGATVNVRVTVSEPANANDKNLIVSLFGTHHPISTILQGQTIEFPMQTGPVLFEDRPLDPFIADVEWSDIEGNIHTFRYAIDVRELENRPANTPPIAHISASLKELAKTVDHFSTGFKVQNVLSKTREERQADKDSLNQYIADKKEK